MNPINPELFLSFPDEFLDPTKEKNEFSEPLRKKICLDLSQTENKIEKAAHLESDPADLSRFVEFLRSKLEEMGYPNQSRELSQLLQTSQILNSLKFIELKSVSSLKNSLIEILQSVQEHDLNFLQKSLYQQEDIFPASLKGIFERAKITQKIKAAEKISNSQERSNALEKIVEELIESKEMDHAIEIANKIPREVSDLRPFYQLINLDQLDQITRGGSTLARKVKAFILGDIFIELLQNEKPEEAIEKSEKITDMIARDFVMNSLIQKLLEQNKLLFAIEAIGKIIDVNYREFSITKINAKMPFEVADSISLIKDIADEKMKELILCRFCQAVASWGYREKAINVAKAKEFSMQIRISALEGIVEILKEQRNFYQEKILDALIIELKKTLSQQ